MGNCGSFFSKKSHLWETGYNCQSRISQGDVRKEKPFDEKKEALTLREEVERGMKNCNFIYEAPFEYVLSKIAGRKRIRFYNPLDDAMVVWIYENPEELIVKKVEGSGTLGATLKIAKLSLEVNGAKERRSDDPLPVTTLTVPPGVTIPVYVQSSSVYITIGKSLGILDNQVVIQVYQHHRLIPTSSIFIFRPYHTKHPLGYLSYGGNEGLEEGIQGFGSHPRWQSAYAKCVGLLGEKSHKSGD